MINMNLQRLRKLHKLTQEQLSEQVGVSRQAIAKWECGESMPDLESCMKLAKVYDVTMDDLINFNESEASGLVIPTKGKYFFGSVTVGERGQIVIPKKARETFKIEVGDQLLVLGEEGSGLALVHQRDVMNFMDMVKTDNK